MEAQLIHDVGSVVALPVPPRPIQLARTIVAVLTGLLIVLLQVNINPGFGSAVDDGWQHVLTWGISHGAQWGTQLVFTYGPLGFLMPGVAFDPATYWPTLILQHIFAIATALLVVVNLRALPLGAGVALLLATIVLGWSWSTSSALMIVYPLAMLTLERAVRRGTMARGRIHLLVAALAAYASLLPLIKFSTFPLWLAWLPLGAVLTWRSYDRVLPITFVLVSVAIPIIAWLACGQQLANLPRFVSNSWHMAVHYGAAMQGDPTEPVSDLVALGATLFGIACTTVLAWRERNITQRIVVCAMVGVTLSLAYRAGATRADAAHLMIVWSMCAWCAPLLAGMLGEESPARSGRNSVSIFVLALLALSLPAISGAYPSDILRQMYSGHQTFAYASQRIAAIRHPIQTYNRELARWTSDRNALQLPGISHSIGKDSADVLMNAQSVLLANSLNYRPRPVFQSYSAYSDHLARMNSDFLQSRDAPDWIILKWESIDNRFPTSDDARALVRLLQDYHPLRSEGDFLLFRRNAINHKPFGEGQRFNIPIGFRTDTPVPPAPGHAWFARIDVGLTAYGKLRTLLFREPTLAVEVKLRDGTRHRYNLVRGVAESGFMLTPAIATNGQYLDWLQGEDNRDVVAIRLVQRRFLNHRVFRTDGPLRLSPLILPRHDRRTLALYADYYPGFNRMPDTVNGQPRQFKVDGKPVMFLGAPGTLTFQLPTGMYEVSAKFGLMPNALTDAGCLKAHPDGVGLTVGIQGDLSNPTRTAYINPFRNPQDGYAASFSGRISVKAGQTVAVLLTSGPTGSNGACDWSWIRDLHFEPVAPQQ